MVQKKTLLIQNTQVQEILSDPIISVGLVEQFFKDYNSKNILQPTKISQIFDEDTQDRINCMPATLMNEKVSGVKWISVFPNNPKLGMNNVQGLLVLSEIEHGFPIAIIEASTLTSVRTAAVSACGVKYLAKENAETIGFIGSGREARSHFFHILAIRPTIKTCYVSSRDEASVEKFINELSSMAPDVTFINCKNHHKKAVENADIIVTATSAQAPLLKVDWIKKGATYVHVGGWEDEYAVAKKADKIVCDQWDSVKHRASQTLSRMYRENILSDSDIFADLSEIVSGNKLGRESDDEFNYFNSVGLAYIDVSLGYYIYNLVKTKEDNQYFEFGK